LIDIVQNRKSSSLRNKISQSRYQGLWGVRKWIIDPHLRYAQANSDYTQDTFHGKINVNCRDQIIGILNYSLEPYILKEPIKISETNFKIFINI